MRMMRIVFISLLLISSLSFAAPDAKLFEQLDSEIYEERASAQKNLFTWAEQNIDDAVAVLLKNYISADGPEAKIRLLEILKHYVLFEKYGAGPGFVGIMMGDAVKRMEGKNHSVVEIIDVVKDSPAKKYGLKVGDRIWRVDKVMFHKNQEPSRQFKAYVASKQKGDTVKLELLRLEKTIEIDLVLGALPAEYLTPTDRKTDEKYFREWLNSHLNSSKPTSKNSK